MSKVLNEVGTVTKCDFTEPPMYNVVFLNDDVTTVDFVEHVLITYFGKSNKEAKEIVDEINNNNRSVVGTFYRDVALTKASFVVSLAKKNNFPFQVITEEVN